MPDARPGQNPAAVELTHNTLAARASYGRWRRHGFASGLSNSFGSGFSTARGIDTSER